MLIIRKLLNIWNVLLSCYNLIVKVITYRWIFVTIVFGVPFIVMLTAYGRIIHRLWNRHSSSISPMNMTSTDSDKRLTQNFRRIVGTIVIMLTVFCIFLSPVGWIVSYSQYSKYYKDFKLTVAKDSDLSP